MKVREILEAVKPVWKPNKNYSDTNPVVTVILPTFRRAKSGFFEKAVESVINQTYTSWELIIVDDASTDGTEALINFYMELDSRISTIRHTNNMGLPAISEYEGYMKARGEYIAFIFDDNEWESCHLMSSVKNMIVNGLDFMYGLTNLYCNEDQCVCIGREFSYLPITNVIGNGSVVIHRKVIEKIGFYDPHLSLTRLCDWDFWNRIVNEYVISFYDKILTNEYGISLKDSLGNSVDINTWVSLERMSYYRNEKLKPANFPELDVLEIADNNTDFYCGYIADVYRKYSKKCWYNNISADIFRNKAKEKKKRVLIITYTDATYFLSFDKLREYAVIKVDSFASETAIIEDAVFADAVIFVRDVCYAHKIADIMKKSLKKCPAMFLFLDDNYFELAKEKNIPKSDIKTALQIVDVLNREQCRDYSGIVVSSDPLKQYFSEKNIHDKIECLLPSVSEEEIVSLTDVSDAVNIGFMGGGFRVKTFVTTVFPAILKISKEKRVKLVCTETLSKSLNENYNIPDDIELVSLPINPCYPQFLQRIKRENINILIHSGEKIKNNKYKTKNALINAVKLGAVLITSDVPPYLDTDAIVTAKTTADDWYDAIKKYALDENARDEQYQRQCGYVRREYSKEKAGEIFTKLLENVKNCSDAEIMDRYSALLISKNNQIIEYAKNVPPAPVVIAPPVNSIWNPDRIIFSGSISDRKKYFIRSTVAHINKLGIIFTSLSEQKVSGTVVCRIKDKKHKTIGISRVNIDKIVYNNWTYFPFVNIELPTEFYLEFEFDYDSDNVYLGIYENISNRSLRYRIANKLKLPYYGVNVPLIDLSNLN